MDIKNLREWLGYMKGRVSTATNRPATVGELMSLVELLIEIEEDNKKNQKHGNTCNN